MSTYLREARGCRRKSARDWENLGSGNIQSAENNRERNRGQFSGIWAGAARAVADLWDEVACWGAVCDIVGVFETNGRRDRGDVKQMKNLERKASFRIVRWWNKCLSTFFSLLFHLTFSIFSNTCSNTEEEILFFFLEQLLGYNARRRNVSQ